MKKLKTLIRSIILEIYQEAEATVHFTDRVEDRFNNGRLTTPPFDASTIKDKLDAIKNIQFPKNQSIAIIVTKLKETHSSKDPETGKVSTGNIVFAIVRGNNLTTIFLRGSQQPNSKTDLNVDYIVNFDKLMSQRKPEMAMV